MTVWSFMMVHHGGKNSLDQYTVHMIVVIVNPLPHLHCHNGACLYIISAVIDLSEKGSLKECTLLKPFKEEGQFAKFGELGMTASLDEAHHQSFAMFLDMLNYSINVYEEGNVLCIVTTGGK